MAAIAFDPLEYAHQLEASGVPREQAEVHAKAMTAVFVHNMDALVTKDYLDTRFNEFETRVEAKIDQRFHDVDQRFHDVDQRFHDVGQRFQNLESRMDLRFAELESRMDIRFARLNVIQGVILAALAIPVLQTLLTWVG